MNIYDLEAELEELTSDDLENAEYIIERFDSNAWIDLHPNYDTNDADLYITTMGEQFVPISAHVNNSGEDFHFLVNVGGKYEVELNDTYSDCSTWFITQNWPTRV